MIANVEVVQCNGERLFSQKCHIELAEMTYFKNSISNYLCAYNTIIEKYCCDNACWVDIKFTLIVSFMSKVLLDYNEKNFCAHFSCICDFTTEEV